MLAPGPRLLAMEASNVAQGLDVFSVPRLLLMEAFPPRLGALERRGYKVLPVVLVLLLSLRPFFSFIFPVIFCKPVT